MDFKERLLLHAQNIKKVIETQKITTEEGTKNALIMPFIKDVLGYNVFDPSEVNPEFDAEMIKGGTSKKMDKVDYAIMKEGRPIILVECKDVNADLNKEHASQLFSYFVATEAPNLVGILTNGKIYQFYTDTVVANVMDKTPFLEINLLEMKESSINELKRFTKENFKVEGLTSVAEELKYTQEIKRQLDSDITSPSGELVKYLAGKVYPRKLTQNAKERFSIIITKALQEFLNEKINERLKKAIDKAPEEPSTPLEGDVKEEPVTTPEEIESYNIIRAILAEIVDPSQISIRDRLSYCGILFDDNQLKPIARLYFKEKKKEIGIFDKDKKEEKFEIENPRDLFKFKRQLKVPVKKYLETEKESRFTGEYEIVGHEEHTEEEKALARKTLDK